LFGNGERTGNVDVVTLALNLFSQGVDPCLDLHDLPSIVETYEDVTNLEVEPRRPYAGQLVFAAFSGGHQDAIAKGLAWREMNDPDSWSVPYLLIDPTDVSRHYETDVIRINSQSGKGGIGFILERNFGYDLPRSLRAELSSYLKDASAAAHKELSPDEVNSLFHEEYVNRHEHVKLVDFHFTRSDDNLRFTASALFEVEGERLSVVGHGNGRLNSVVDALRKIGIYVHIEAYAEHALDEGSTSRAAAYVGISAPTEGIIWGVGEHHDIVTASIRGLISAVNRSL
jgi:2-isopropylmalate synthase